MAKRDPMNAEGFVVLTDIAPQIDVELRYHTAFNFIGEPIPGYEENCALVTRPCALAMKAAVEDLQKRGYGLKVYDAYRPRQAVERIVRWVSDAGDTRMKTWFYPNLNKSLLIRQDYIGRRSAHSRGSTVDVTLTDPATGEEADMGGPFDFFGALSHGDYPGVTEEQRQRRLLLRTVMEAHGFLSLDSEWWHFRLADEPFPDTWFTFPVRRDSVKRGGS